MWIPNASPPLKIMIEWTVHTSIRNVSTSVYAFDAGKGLFVLENRILENADRNVRSIGMTPD